jgi:cell wall-associated NlpC family hydrolase
VAPAQQSRIFCLILFWFFHQGNALASILFMKNKRLINNLSLFSLILFSFLLLLLSCASSSRTINNTQDKNHYSVPSNNDYRKNCKVPEDKLKRIVNSYLGVRYKSGGMDRRGFDCSGFVVVVYRELNHAKLPRSTGKLKWVGRRVSKSDACPGDLVFVKGGAFNSINHVGIYMGNNTFVHASTSKGVRYDRLDDEYYTKHFAMIRRVF